MPGAHDLPLALQGLAIDLFRLSLRLALLSPAFHPWHHTRHGVIDRNFASMLPVFDRLFGTLHLPRTWPLAYGIDATLPGSLTGQWLASWRPDKAAR